MHEPTSRRINITAVAITGILILTVGLAGAALTSPMTWARDGETAAGSMAASPGNGRTELMRVAKLGNHDRVLALLKAGADVNQANPNGGTPLMYATLGGDRKIVALMVDRGADVNATASNGWGALMIAVAKGYDDIVRLLLQRGADPNLPDVYQWTPLMRAVFEHRLQASEILLADARTDVNQRGEHGATALHLAASQSYQDLVRLLLQHGARKGMRDEFGRTAHAVAAQQSGTPVLVELLKD